MAIIVIAILFQDVFAIGTDNWGYSWEILSYFEWREIRTSGTSLPLSADDEFFMIIYNDFPFYDRYYDTLFITSNGMVSFERGTRAYRNQALPADTVPPFIAPFWDDLSPQNGGGIAYLVDPDDSSLIVEWYDAPHYSSGGPYTFELILKKTGEIYFSYLNMNEPLNSATVGMQCNEHFLQLLMNGDPPENIPFDSLTLLIRRMRREIRVDTLLSPPELVRPSDIFYPSLKISNLSDIDTSAFAFIKITGLSGIPGYYDSILVNLSPHSSITAEFTNSWTPSSDSAYNITAWCSIEGDEIPSDDTLKKTVLSLTRGYWVLNSRDDGEIVRFQWIEISGTGINSGLSGDDDVRQFEMLPFVFPFVDTAFTSLYISTNGFISFTDSRNDYNNQNFPSDIRNILAPFWDDLILNNPSSAIYIKHDTTENIFVVEWSDISHYGSSASYTFETILYPDGSFKYQYLRMSGVVNQSTIGYQYGLGETYYNSFLYNGAPAGHIPSDSFAIMYVPYTPFSRTDAAVVRVANNLSNITVGT
ncbi:MAG: nidogen-like domain-containing protein, partial [bacterium]